MQYIIITWKTGRQTKILPSILNYGESRDVLCGTDVATNKESDVVVKMQTWRWHAESNGHEFDIANRIMKFCTPNFYGVHRVAYETRYAGYNVTYDLSVSVVEKVPRTMKDYTTTMLASPVTYYTMHMIYTWVRSLLELVYVICEELKMRASDFHSENIGLADDHKLLVIDCESITDGAALKPKERAKKGVKDFFTKLEF